jgi:type I restriction enzyme R subunit
MDNKHNTEADARIEIDEALRVAGWDPSDKSQVRTEVSMDLEGGGVVCEPQAAYGDSAVEELPDGDQVPTGRADYVLSDQQGKPLAVIEAKRNAIDPYSAKRQALPMARAMGAPFIFLTNGNLIYFWDYKMEDARPVSTFFSRKDLERMVYMRQEQKPMAEIEVPEYYLRNGDSRKLRPYQTEAMHALDHAVELNKRRFLIQLPTGTGKTDLICLYLKRLLEAGRADRILFLVDREQLAKQAIGAVQDLLGQYSSYWLKSGGVDRRENQITVCLLQTMISRYQEFTSGYFDVVVMDESHRSIYGAWQQALTHFDALHIGLTATPATYIERNTYTFYGCDTGQPDFTYDIREAFQKGFLTPYTFATGLTKVLAEGADVDETHYDPSEFERKWTNEATNRLMMEEFDNLAWASYSELAPGQKEGPGKSIVFAITKHHAARLARYLNELHPESNGKYAEVITSDVADADGVIRTFKHESYPQVAVSVGMLDTGFDCPEVLHLVMCRRVRSPILYQQMRGRGTRTAPHIGKKRFVIYDFFGNHEYFNDSDTDIFSGGSGSGGGSGEGGGEPPPPRELVEAGLQDEWYYAVTYVEVGEEGERVDKQEYKSHWETTIREAVDEDTALGKIREGNKLTADEEKALEDKLNQPEMYFNEENLRRAYNAPGENLIDFIKEALGLAKVKSYEERLQENFQAWVVSKKMKPEQAQYLNLLKNRGLPRKKVEITDLFEPPLSVMNAAGRGVELFGEDGLKRVIADLNASVFAVSG